MNLLHRNCQILVRDEYEEMLQCGWSTKRGACVRGRMERKKKTLYVMQDDDGDGRSDNDNWNENLKQYVLNFIR